MRRLALAFAAALLLLAGCGGSAKPHLWLTHDHGKRLTACVSADCGAWTVTLNWTVPPYPNTTGYNLFLNGVQYGTATSSPFLFSGTDCGVHVTLGVQAHNGSGGTGPVWSTPYSSPACGNAPVNSAIPAVSGTPAQGSALSTTNGSWLNAPTSFAYQWQDCSASGTGCSNIVGATASGYTLQASDVGATLRSVVTASNALGSASATSNATSVVTGSSGGGSGPFTCPASVRCFFISSSAGSDSNTVTQAQSESTPWATAPGMAGTAHAGYAHQVGDEFIFKGGDRWGNSDFPLVPAGSGNAAHADYYGVDVSWFAGASFARPTFDAQLKPISGTKDTIVDLTGVDYITIDNVEFTGFCAQSTTNACSASSGAGRVYSYPNCTMINLSAGFNGQDQNITLNRLYIHNWWIDLANMPVSGTTECDLILGYTAAPFAGNSILENSTIAGDGNAYGSPVKCLGNIENDVIHDAQNLIFPCGHGQVSGNLLYDCASPHSPTDGGVGNLEHNDAVQVDNSDGALYIHDNVIHDISPNPAEAGVNGCETMLIGNPGETDYVWNNVIYNSFSNAISLTQNSSPGVAAFIWNNSIEGGFNGAAYCVRSGHPATWTTISVQNNLCVSSTSQATDPALAATALTIDHNPVISPATAAADGYGPSEANVYSPDQSLVPTLVKGGVNLASNCTVNVTLCSDTTFAGTRTAMSRGAAWDVGAYQRLGAGSAWYVDPNATGANNGTSWANAWTSLAAINWTGVHAGDTVYLSGGATSQTYTAPMTVSASGTAGTPIVIEPGGGAGHSGTVIFDYNSCGASCSTTALNLNGNSYLTLEGLGRWQMNNLFNTANRLATAGISDSGSTGVTVDDMSFTNDNNPIRIQNATGTTVSNNSLNHIRGDAAIGVASSTGTFDANQVFGNYIETVCQQNGACNGGNDTTCGGAAHDGPDGVQTGAGVSIHDNHFKEVVGAVGEVISCQHPDMIQNQSNFTKVYNNDFENVGDSNFDYDAFAAGGSVHDIWIYNNVFHITTQIDPFPDFIRLYYSAGSITSITNFKVMNNVFADANVTGNIPPVNICYYEPCTATATGSGSQIANNLFVNDGSGSSSGPMMYVGAAAGGGWTATNNDYYRSSGPFVSWKGTTFTAASFIASVDTAGKSALPTFNSYTTNSASNDFHLQSGDTVGRGNGTDLSAFFATDKDGTRRTVPWSMGAYK